MQFLLIVKGFVNKEINKYGYWEEGRQNWRNYIE